MSCGFSSIQMKASRFYLLTSFSVLVFWPDPLLQLHVVYSHCWNENV